MILLINPCGMGSSVNVRHATCSSIFQRELEEYMSRLFDCVNGDSSFMELWTCMSRFPCFEVTATLSLAAACSSAGVTVLYSRDLGYCRSPQIPCSHFKASILFAFISWFLLAVSSHVTFWLLAAV
ncbi:hypothetical protein V6Z11_D10G273900 [Gossypium hirsutum]